MPAYRAYVLDRADHINDTEVIEAVSFRDAVHAAMTLLRDLPDDQTSREPVVAPCLPQPMSHALVALRGR